MRLLGIVFLAFSAVSLSGCGSLLQKFEGDNNFLVAAVPLCAARPGYVYDASLGDKNDGCRPAIAADGNTASADDAVVKRLVGNVVLESELKCSRFLNGMVLAENTTTTGLDSATTLFSALATAFSPIATVHALTAASTVTSGWRANINADIYAKASIRDYSQAIETSYYSKMANYIESLNTSHGLTYQVEVAKLAIFHKTCTLASAQGVIQNSLKAETSDAATTLNITVSKSPTADKTTYSISSTSDSKTAIAAATYVAAKKDRPEVIADKLVDAINKTTSDFFKNGITASQGDSKGSLVLHIPGSLDVKWQASPDGSISIAESNSQSGATTKPSVPTAAGGK